MARPVISREGPDERETQRRRDHQEEEEREKRDEESPTERRKFSTSSPPAPITAAVAQLTQKGGLKTERSPGSAQTNLCGLGEAVWKDLKC